MGQLLCAVVCLQEHLLLFPESEGMEGPKLLFFSACEL